MFGDYCTTETGGQKFPKSVHNKQKHYYGQKQTVEEMDIILWRAALGQINIFQQSQANQFISTEIRKADI